MVTAGLIKWNQIVYFAPDMVKMVLQVGTTNLQ